MKESRKSRLQRRKAAQLEVRELEQSLQETRVLIAQAYAGFNAAADSELVESYVYEIQALQARYSYLLAAPTQSLPALEPQTAQADPLEAGAGEASPSPLPVA